MRPERGAVRVTPVLVGPERVRDVAGGLAGCPIVPTTMIVPSAVTKVTDEAAFIPATPTVPSADTVVVTVRAAVP